jgi:hypothetical protein
MTRKQKISAALKNIVWADAGGNEFRVYCYACLRIPLTFGQLQCGHIIAESKGGKTVVTNLRPVCIPCNGSIGTNNMNDYIRDNQLWVGCPGYYWKDMLLKGEDPLLLYPESKRTPSLLRRLAVLRTKVDAIIALRDNGDEIREPIAPQREEQENEPEEEVLAEPAPTIVTPCPIPRASAIPTVVFTGPKLKWKDALYNAILRYVTETSDPSFTMQQLVSKELPRIVREVHCTGLTPINTMARELQQLRKKNILTFVDYRGLYQLHTAHMPILVE